MLLRLFAPQVMFYGLVTLGSALLNSHRRFAAAAFAPGRQQRDAHLRAAGGLAGDGPRHQRGGRLVGHLAGAAPRAGDDRRHRGHGPRPLAGHHPGPDPGALALRRAQPGRPAGGRPLGLDARLRRREPDHPVRDHLARVRHAGRGRGVGLDLRVPVLPAALRRVHRLGHGGVHAGAGQPGHVAETGRPSRIGSCSVCAWWCWCCCPRR